MKRQRGRSRRSNNQHNANRSMESNGPDVKVRGTAKQIFDKYESLARDAASSGNRVKAENFRQHAEHYLRIVNAIEAAKEKTRIETETAKAESDESSDDSDGKEDGKSGEKDEYRSRRRYPPQVRKSSDDESQDENADNKEDDVVEEAIADEKESGSEKKPARRRKAPSRAKSDSEDATTEAAE